jgi:hypothetical protein
LPWDDGGLVLHFFLGIQKQKEVMMGIFKYVIKLTEM